MSYELPKIDLKAVILTIVLVTGAIVFCMGALANVDPLWFLPYSNEMPAYIIVYQNDCKVTILPGQSGFEEFAAALNQTLSQIDGYEPGFGLSVESLKEYREKERAVEAYFDKPIKIHVPYRFGDPSNILIPITGYFAETRSLFGGRDGDYWSGALRLKTIEPLRRAAEQVRCQ